MTKGIEGKRKIDYEIQPRFIEIVERGTYKMCDNCASNGDFTCYAIKMNKTDFADLNGRVGARRYAKPREIWLCEDCFNELKNAINKFCEVKNEEKG